MPNVSLLILWLLPSLTVVGPARSPDLAPSARPLRDGAPAAIRRTTDLPEPGDPGRLGLVASLDDEEDSSEDGSVDVLLPACFEPERPGTEVSFPFAPSGCVLPRSSCRTNPLRC